MAYEGVSFMSKKLKILLLIATSMVILLALQISTNSFKAQSIINAWFETAFQESAATIQENDQIKILSPTQSDLKNPSSSDLVDESRR